MPPATAERTVTTEEALGERLHRRLATYVIPLIGEPLQPPVVAHRAPGPTPRSRLRVALAALLAVGTWW